MKDLFNTVLNAPVSEGGIHYLLNKLVKKLQSVYDLIKQNLQSTSLLNGADEAGVKVCGKKHWTWPWQNEKATFIKIKDNSGQQSKDQTFKNGFENSVLIYDC